MYSLVNICVFFISIFASIDGLRDTFFPGSIISYSKEIFVITLFTLLIYERIINGKNILTDNYFHYLLWAFVLIESALVTLYFSDKNFSRGEGLGFGGWSVWAKVLIGLLLVQSFSWLREFNNCTIYKNIPIYFLSGTVFYCILSIFYIATGLSDNLVQRDWQGRLSIGYPTMDSFVLVIACLFLVFFVKNKFILLFAHLLIVILLFMQNTISGYLMLLTYLIGLSFILKGNWKFLPITSILAITGLMIFSYFFIFDSLGIFGALIIDKINGLFLGTDTPSTSLRNEQIEHLKSLLLADKVTLFFGLGGEAAFLTENNIFANLGLGGIIGAIFNSIIFARILLCSIKSTTSKFIFPGAAIYVAGSLSLISLYLFPFVFFFAFLYSFAQEERQK